MKKIILIIITSLIFLSTTQPAHAYFRDKWFTAAINCDVKSLSKQLNAPYNINIVNKPSWMHANTALHEVAGSNISKASCIKAAELLLHNGADVDAKNAHNQTPLIVLVNQRSDRIGLDHRIELAQFLIDNGADVNHRSFWGYAPLHYIAEKGDLKMTKFLLHNGADVSIPNKDGKTPLDLSKANEHDDVSRYLTREMEFKSQKMLE